MAGSHSAVWERGKLQITWAARKVEGGEGEVILLQGMREKYKFYQWNGSLRAIWNCHGHQDGSSFCKYPYGGGRNRDS